MQDIASPQKIRRADDPAERDQTDMPGLQPAL
jgi:hypothetical protein